MKQKDVHVGETYVAKVSGKFATVRLDRENRYGGWDATNLDTGKQVRIKSARRLHCRGKMSRVAEAKACQAVEAHRSPGLPVGTRVQVRSEHFAEQCEGIITAAGYDDGWLYAIDVTAGDPLTRHRNAIGELWLCASEVHPLPAAESVAASDGVDEEEYDPDRCATPGCPGAPCLTHRGRPLCADCWAKHCDEGEPQGPQEENTEMAKKTKKSENAERNSRAKDRAPRSELTAEETAKLAAKRKTKAAKDNSESKPKRASAIDAAAQILRKAGKPLDCKTMIERMAEQGLWSSPNGKTPAATLYSAILREIGTKGKESRFKKVERGQFAPNA